jgi:hypothetical protein
MPRRRVYVFDLAAILADSPPPPRRFRQSLAYAALTGVLLAFGIVFVRLAAEAIPSFKLETAFALAVAYLCVVSLFWAFAVRVRWWRL